jgi:hypothetical protein
MVRIVRDERQRLWRQAAAQAGRHQQQQQRQQKQQQRQRGRWRSHRNAKPHSRKVREDLSQPHPFAVLRLPASGSMTRLPCCKSFIRSYRHQEEDNADHNQDVNNNTWVSNQHAYARAKPYFTLSVAKGGGGQ